MSLKYSIQYIEYPPLKNNTHLSAQTNFYNTGPNHLPIFTNSAKNLPAEPGTNSLLHQCKSETGVIFEGGCYFPIFKVGSYTVSMYS